MKPRILDFTTATPQEAVTYFGRELGFEVDPVDLAQDLAEGRTEGYVLAETRSLEKYHEARLPGAIHLPYWEITAERMRASDKSLTYVCYCESIHCNAATQGALRLAALGFTVKRLSGGITTWRSAGYPTETGPRQPLRTLET
ncbi:rhodanese-like domain-containing protein [Amycolatopsis rhabdoformis]|uniref:Rhodanese-like domain-containing protein n=1 Tax=Amycolatopsis rhabdoformis TaxID=1448059 RepID=A0ABZ1I5W8_9PSEU|nr:rhodanese-like domain-containing protein [Amycolatopsis rhabdoformis]WSE29619.1 rhodanese-like domain-containing protein [Amycolatopsis rhabdoformis]